MSASPAGVWTFSTHLGAHAWSYVRGTAGAAAGETDAEALAAEATRNFRRLPNPNVRDEPLRRQMRAENAAAAAAGAAADAPAAPLREPASARTVSADAAPALRAAAENLAALQCTDGHWAGDYAGPMFLMTGMLIACRLSGREFGVAERAAMRAYLRNVQSASDGGWGLHIESRSTMFGTVLNYIALRLLGCPADDPDAARARAWIRDRGGAVSCPSWGKFWMCILGVYDYRGVNPVNPDLWLLPAWCPISPGQMWCHSRMVYLPMGYCYANRVAGPVDDLVLALRSELFVSDYDTVDWTAARDDVYQADIYHPPSRVLRFLNAGLRAWETYLCPRWLRRRAIDEVWLQIQREDSWTNYASIGPVNKMFNMVVHWHMGNTAGVEAHWRQLPAYLWVAEDGMKMSGQVGSQCWDTSFTVCALVESGIVGAAHPAAASDGGDGGNGDGEGDGDGDGDGDNGGDRGGAPPSHTAPRAAPAASAALERTMRRAAKFIDAMQMQADMPDRARYYRSATKGAWPFTIGSHGWAISDCTAEGFAAAMHLRTLPCVREDADAARAIVPLERLKWTVDLLLTEQNRSGGWSSYERQRGGDWWEVLNPSEVFGKIMTDYQYVECTASSVISLRHFQHASRYRSAEIDAACARAARFIDAQQRDDGSFYGSWAVCFTYAAWFAIRGLVACGRDPRTCPTIRRACEFLLTRQREDGGWGEAFASCEVREYVEAPTSQCVNTAWAAAALMTARWADTSCVERAIGFLIREQDAEGGWHQDVISGGA
jgi:squalene cyclase